MSKRERIEAKKLEALEVEFLELLVPCLEQCARGRWGLFGAYDGFPEIRYWMNWPEVDPLREVAKSIRKLRAASGEKNDLCEEYLIRCSIRRANDPGEPQMAREFLDSIRNVQRSGEA